MKTYNGPQYDGLDTINENSFENAPVREKKKIPIIILIVLGVIIGLLIIYGILSSMITKILEQNSSINEVLLEDDINEEQIYDSYNNEEQEKVNELTGMIADTWEDQGKYFSGNTQNRT